MNSKSVILTLSLTEGLLLQKMILSSRVDTSEEKQAYEILSKLEAALK